MGIYIHRPSSITGDDAPTMDLMTNLLTYSEKMRKTPKSSMWKGGLDFVSVENVARGILDQVRNEDLTSSGTVKYLHQTGELEVPIESMRTFLERETGEVFDSLSVETWVREAIEGGMNELIGAYLISAADLPIIFPKLLTSRC
jgi:hybrid polyketide synthase/nonribosomal peptide synthetase ACE1